MKDIGELIGIFKGVQFDEVINQKEIDRLKKWIGKNKNITYSSEQAELIELVNTTIKDHVIAKDEYDQVISYCEKYCKEFETDRSKLYELNGIIDGIICDGVVNELEVYHLKEWMDNNKTLLKDSLSTKSLCETIERIISDGIVSEEEQEEMLEVLSDRIQNSKFEEKLESLRKKVRNKKNIGIDLIELLNDEYAIAKIHTRAEQSLQNILNSYVGSYSADQDIVFISLVLIALLYYDGNFYESVRNTYQHLYSIYSEQKIEGTIRSIINRYRSDEYEWHRTSRVITTVLVNAIVPSYFLKSFFEFIFDIYKINFNYSLSEDLEKDFEFVYDGVRKYMLSDDDELQLNVTNKSYKLIKSTKQLISDPDRVEPVIQLSIIVVKLIDKRFWNRDYQIYNPYLKQGFGGWEKQLIDAQSSCSKIREKGVLCSRWEPKFILNGNTVFLLPPVHRISSIYDYRNVNILVKNGSTIIYQDDSPEIKEIIGGYQISVDPIRVHCPLGKLGYFLMCGDEILYDSKNKLNRDFIVFDQNGNEIENNSDYEGAAVFCVSHDSASKQAFYYQSDMYDLWTKIIHTGDVELVDDTVFNFSDLIKPGIVGEEYHNCYIRQYDNKLLQVYKNVKYLIFECDSSIRTVIIALNENKYFIEQIQHSIVERRGIKKYCVDISEIQDGIHTVEVFACYKGKQTRIMKDVFAVDSVLSYELEKNDNHYFISINSALFEKSRLVEFHLDDFCEEIFHFSYLAADYFYLLPFDLDAYRLSGKKWKPIRNEMWIGDVSPDTDIEVYNSEIKSVSIMSSTGEKLENEIDLRRKGSMISFRIGFLSTYKSSFDYTIILLCDSAGKAIKAIYYYNKCILDEKHTDIRFDPVTNELTVIPYIYGKGSVFVTVVDDNGYQIYKSSILKSSEIVHIPDIESFREYRIQFCEKPRGLSLKKENLIKEYRKIFYGWNGFVGRSFKVKKVDFYQLIRGKFLKKTYYFNNVFIKFTEKTGNDSFIGDIYAQHLNGRYYLNNLNPVSIEICGSIDDGSLEISVTKDGDGLLLDFSHRGILNSLDDRNAVDIFSYIIEVK